MGKACVLLQVSPGLGPLLIATAGAKAVPDGSELQTKRSTGSEKRKGKVGDSSALLRGWKFFNTEQQ